MALPHSHLLVDSDLLGNEAIVDSDSLIIVGDILKYSTRPAQSSDYEFLFELKKAAEFEPIKAVLAGMSKFNEIYTPKSGQKNGLKSLNIKAKRLAVYCCKTKATTSILPILSTA